MKIKKRGKTVTIKFENVSESTRMLRSLGFTNIADLQTRVAEQRDAPVHAEPKCPSCVGMGVVDDGGFILKCFACDGTGILNRSAGG